MQVTSLLGLDTPLNLKNYASTDRPTDKTTVDATEKANKTWAKCNKNKYWRNTYLYKKMQQKKYWMKKYLQENSCKTKISRMHRCSVGLNDRSMVLDSIQSS